MNARRVESAQRWWQRRWKIEEATRQQCDVLIGELQRAGATWYYVFDRRGKVREFRDRPDAVDFLIRNKYVTW